MPLLINYLHFPFYYGGRLGDNMLKAVHFTAAVATALLILCTAGTATAKLGPTSSILLDAESGEIISSERPDTVRYPASLTKLMTLYITFEALEKGIIKMDDELTVSHYAANRSPSRLGLKPGSKIKVKTAIIAVIVKSANDCATVLAESLGYNEKEFAKNMTAVAKTLGMKKTVFKNASGLPNRQQVTTARDMAVLGAALYHHFPQYYPLFATQKFTYNGQTIYSHNHLLKNFDGADGMKTGYIAAAGFNIITSAERNGNRVIAVTMGHKTLKERDKKVAQMMEKGLQKLALNKQQAEPVYAKLESPQTFSIEKMAQMETTAVKSSEGPKFRGKWAVQIGAFSNYAKARIYALKVKRSNPELKETEVDIEPVSTASAIVYRSKLVNFSKNDADDFCNSLKKENKSCIVVAVEKDSNLLMAYKQ